MTAPAPLQPADTSALDPTLARHWAVQVRKSASDPWTFVYGLNSVSDNIDKTRQEGGDFHGGNYGAQVATMGQWSLELGVQRKLNEGEPDEGVEILRSLQGKLGGEELVHVRWWRTDGLPDSYQGRAGVTFKNAGGDQAALQGATITLSGFGNLLEPPKPTEVAVNEVQRLDVTGAPTSFKAKFLGYTTSAITWSSLTASTLQTAIQGLTGIGSGNALVTGDNTAGYVITFAAALAGVDVPKLEAVDIVGGTDPKVVFKVVTEGHPAG